MGKESLPQIVTAAVAVERKSGFPAEVMVSQIVLESAWLTKMTGDNNCLGYKSFNPKEPRKLCVTTEWFTDAERNQFLARGDSRNIVRTTGRTRGKEVEYVVKDWFRSYATLADCFADYLRLLTSKPRYKGCWDQYLNDHNIDNLINGIAAAGYAESPDYAALVRKIAHQSDVQVVVQQERARQAKG